MIHLLTCCWRVYYDTSCYFVVILKRHKPHSLIPFLPIGALERSSVILALRTLDTIQSRSQDNRCDVSSHPSPVSRIQHISRQHLCKTDENLFGASPIPEGIILVSVSSGKLFVIDVRWVWPLVPMNGIALSSHGSTQELLWSNLATRSDSCKELYMRIVVA